MIRPSLHQLEVFCKVVQLESMARAAEAFTVAPSSVSMQIQQLEQRFRVPLLVRSHRRTVPTSAGAALYTFAEGVLEGLDAVEREIMAIGALESGVLRFASGRTIGAAVVRPALQTFEQNHPEMDVTYHMMASSEQAKSEVLEGRAEFALLGRVEPDWPIEATPFFAEPLVVAMSVDHPLAQRANLTASSLSGTPLLLRESPVLGRDRVVAALEDVGVHPQVIELGSTEAIKAEVIAGAGVTVLPQTVVEEAVEAGQLMLRTFRGLTPDRTIYLATLPKTPLSPGAEAFVCLMRERYGMPQEPPVAAVS